MRKESPWHHIVFHGRHGVRQDRVIGGIMIGNVPVTLLLVVLLAGCAGWDVGPLFIPTDIVVADLDSNGLPDVLVIASYRVSYGNSTGHLVVHRQLSPGQFDSPTTYLVGSYPWQLVVEDIDRDGALDVLIADAEEHVVYLLLQDPAVPGRLGAPSTLDGSATHYSVATADLDNDGWTDIVTPDSAGSRLVVHYQDPLLPGTFRVSHFPLTSPPVQVATGDLNADGLDDVLVVLGDGLAYALQEAAGQLGRATYEAPESGLNAKEIAIVDYDGDLHNDILVYYTQCCAGIQPVIRVLLQHAAMPGTFLTPVDTIPARQDSLAFADLDGDGLPDAVGAGLVECSWGGPCENRSSVDLWQQSGGGAFALVQTCQLPLHVDVISAGDMDLEGAVDLVLLGVDYDGLGNLMVSVMYQSTLVPGSYAQPLRIH